MTDAQFRPAFIEQVPETARDLAEEGVHLQVAALGDAVLAHLRLATPALPLRIADVLHQFLSASRPASEIANALQISFPSASEIATFYSADEVVQLLRKTGFAIVGCGQTLSHSLAETREIEPLCSGCGECAFVVIAAETIRV